MGVLCAYQILVIYKATTYVRFDLVGLSTAVANMIIMVFGTVFHTVIGKSLNFVEGTSFGSISSYSKDAFIAALSIIPIGLFLGGIGFVLLVIAERRRTPKSHIM